MKTLVTTVLVATLFVGTYQQPGIYPGCWTEWFDRDDPTATGDWETLVDLRRENPGKICDNPLQIEVLTTSGASVASTGDVISVSDTTTGFVCKNAVQTKTKMCRDYKVRFMCPVKFCYPKLCWTKWYDRDNPSGDGDWELLSDLRNEYPGQICEHPFVIEVQTVDTNTPAAFTGQSFAVLNPAQGFVCRNADQRGQLCRDYKVRFGCPCP